MKPKTFDITADDIIAFLGKVDRDSIMAATLPPHLKGLEDEDDSRRAAKVHKWLTGLAAELAKAER